MESQRESHHRLVLTLDKFSNNLMGNLQRFTEIEDASGARMVWACCITCLGHLAALSHLISQTEPTLKGSMDKLCDLALDRLRNLSHEAHIKEFTHFDILTGVRRLVVPLQTSKELTKIADQVSWKRALETIDVRIRLYPTESESLGYWREVIGKAYTDFQANPLGYGPSQFTSMASSMDGRTEHSDFPNLLEPKEREPYGL